MFIEEKIIKLQGKVMHYAWGGEQFLPQLLGISNPGQQPFAEYWLGAHPLASSELILPNKTISLFDLIKEHPVDVLSAEVFKAYGELPFLLKIQDVKDILSIQVHPSKEEAALGFDKEEAAGIPLNAAYRNYKDRNHKPEMLVALSDFWLLHGFKNEAAIGETLSEIPALTKLKPYYKREGLKAFYQLVMEMQQPEINALLIDLVKREIRRKKEGVLTKEMPGWWVAKLYGDNPIIGDIDRAVLSMYLFNIVHLVPGEGLFQGAGMPHAYMEGQCVELMANSDNVLRAGLTPKHIDVPELIKHTLFETVVPKIMKGEHVLKGEKIYHCPVPDFCLASIQLMPGESYSQQANSLEIIVVTKGGVVINHSVVAKAGEAVAILPGGAYTIVSSGTSELFKAYVPEVLS